MPIRTLLLDDHEGPVPCAGRLGHHGGGLIRLCSPRRQRYRSTKGRRHEPEEPNVVKALPFGFTLLIPSHT
jgi:hypothetical protein